MIPAELWAEIRRLRLLEKLSISQIAERLDLDRKTVRSALEKETFSTLEYRPRKSLLDPFKPYLKERLEEFPKLSAKRLLEEIRGQGFEGSYTILTDYLRTIRPPKTKAFLPLKFAPGESAQVDWASCGTISVGRHTRRLSCFVMVLSHSRMLYLEFTVSECMEEFLRCHENAFRFFGGHTPEIVYDNLKSVVLQRAEKEIRFNPRFMEFAGFHTFKPVLCRKRAPHEKGRVESGVGYIKKSFLMGRDFDHFDKVNPAAFNWRDAVANVRIHGTTRKRPIDLFEEERKLLVPLPDRSYDTAVVKPVKATVTFRVKFESNTYSVPHRYAGKELTLKATAGEVRIFDKTDLVATHARSFDKYLDIENPEHTEALIRSRQRARREQLVADFLAIGPPAEAYLDGLVHGQLNLYHHLGRLLILDDNFGRHELLGALCTALYHQAFGAHYIENILHQERQRKEMPPPKPIMLADDPQILEARIPEPDLNLYDSLFEDKNHDPKDPDIQTPNDQDNKPADDPDHPPPLNRTSNTSNFAASTRFTKTSQPKRDAKDSATSNSSKPLSTKKPPQGSNEASRKKSSAPESPSSKPLTNSTGRSPKRSRNSAFSTSSTSNSSAQKPTSYCSAPPASARATSPRPSPTRHAWPASPPSSPPPSTSSTHSTHP